MNESHASLFEPVQIGEQTLRSRVVFGSIRTNFAADHRFSARHRAFYERLARGGVGMIVLEESLVHPSDWPYERALFGYDEAIVGSYRMIADALHAQGVPVVAHLSHSGGQGTSAYSQRPLWAPSRVPEVNSNEVPQPMLEDEIGAVVEGFARAATYAVAAGIDGVEINTGQHSLLRQFLSGLTNHREDGYGGELPGRMRFLLEVLRAVRRAIGASALLGLKLSSDEMAPWAGLKPEDSVVIAQHLAEEAGLLDYLTVTRGSIYTDYATRPTMRTAPGFNIQTAAAIHEAISVPVFVQGSIVDPGQVAALIAGGQADGVEMTRALIADPDLVEKVRQGKGETVRPCILCNQRCIVDNAANSPLTCIHNPSAGFELTPDGRPLMPAPAPRRVLVIGGGPAGMEAARVAALRGHEVTLWEKSARLGGVVPLAAQAPGRERVLAVASYLEKEIELAGVTVCLKEEATPATVRAFAPDVVVVATGGRPRPAQLAANGVPVVDQRTVFSNTPSGRRIAIIDHEDGWFAVNVAEHLQAHENEVSIISEEMFVSPKLAETRDLSPWYQKAFSHGIELVPQTEFHKVDGHKMWVKDRFTQDPRLFGDVDVLVVAQPELPEETLYEQLAEERIEVHRAGDCVAPRTIFEAVLEGNRVGRSV